MLSLLAAGFAPPPNQTAPLRRPDETVVLHIPYSQPIVNFEQAARDDFRSKLAKRLDLPLGAAGIRLVVGTSNLTAHISTPPGSSSHVAWRLSFPSAHDPEEEQSRRSRRRLNPSLDEAPPWAPRSALILPDEVARRTGHRTLESTPDRPVVPWSMKPVEERRHEVRGLLLEDTKRFCYQCKCVLCPTLTDPTPDFANTEACPGKECLGKCNAMYGCAKCTSGDDEHNPPQYVWVNGYFIGKDDYLAMASPQLSELWQQPWLFGVSQVDDGLPVAGQVYHTWNALNPCPLSRRYKGFKGETPALCGTSAGLDLIEQSLIEAADHNVVALGLAIQTGKGKDEKLGVAAGGAPVCAEEYNEASWEIAAKLIAEAQGAVQGLSASEIASLEASNLAMATAAADAYTTTITLVSLDDANVSPGVNAAVGSTAEAELLAIPAAYAAEGIALCYDQHPYPPKECARRRKLLPTQAVRGEWRRLVAERRMRQLQEELRAQER